MNTCFLPISNNIDNSNLWPHIYVIMCIPPPEIPSGFTGIRLNYNTGTSTIFRDLQMMSG